MYSGSTIRVKSGRVMGAHQKIDRVARRQLAELIPTKRYFPAINEILHFEGKNGPDGIKRKSPSVDEPWHYVDPLNEDDRALYELIDDHIQNLTTALVDNNRERAAFEAAWLSHAIVDGLTPAHHYPLGDKIEELWGHPKEERTSIKSKNIIPGDTRRERVSKNWQYWGAKGVFTTHVMFEFGVASTLTPMKFADIMPSGDSIVRAKKTGFESIMRESVLKTYDLHMYDEFHRGGWSRRLAHQTRTVLAPIIIRTVMIAWLVASDRAAEKRAAKKA